MRKLLVVLFVLVVLIVGADIVGRLVAQSRVAQEITRQTGTAAPSVSIRGFSFLAQALTGHYQDVTVRSPDLTVGPISGIGATIELYDVVLPLSDALHGDTKNLVAGQATLRAVISDESITGAMAQAGAVVSAGPDGAVRVSATVSIAGAHIPVSADLLTSFADGVLHLDASNLRAAGIALTDVAQLTKDLSLALPLNGLPFPLQGAALTATGSDLLLTATAYQVHLSSAA